MLTIQQEFTVCYRFPIIFTRNVFAPTNPALCQVVEHSGQKVNKVLVVIDSGVMQATPALVNQIADYMGRHRGKFELVASPHIVPGGEVAKQNDSEITQIHALVAQHHLCRHSFIVAVGGGAVLDVAGYAAATAHRGIRLIRMPTTTLSQNDAGVGVKNGFNAYGRKNFLGTFAPPFAVINDFAFLQTLSVRDLRAGIAEAIKVALIKDQDFFEFLYQARYKLAVFEPESMEKMIVRCAQIHIDHIGKSGDPFEWGSARPLDFGHWSAHQLETYTGGNLKHGEAVAIGIALDALYAYRLDLIGQADLYKIWAILEDIGFGLYHPALSRMDCDKALREFQEHLGGRLTVTLVNGIGNKKDVYVLDVDLIKQCIMALARYKPGNMYTF